MIPAMRSRSDAAREILLIVLYGCAGAFDALSFLRLHAFTANMTGNTVLLGLWLGGRHFREASHSVAAIAGYALGAFAGTLLAREADERHPWPPELVRAFALEAALVIAFAVLWRAMPGGELRAVVLLLIGSAAMGTQSAIAHDTHLGSATTTAMTGTIARTAEGFAAWLSRRASSRAPFTGLAWLVYLCTAVGVGALDRGGGAHVVPWVVAAVILTTAIVGRRLVAGAR